jgi:hypothetical protein
VTVAVPRKTRRIPRREWIELLIDAESPASANGAPSGIVLRDAQPPAGKLDVAIENSPEFARTWRRGRREFPSQSEYDLSLASQAAAIGWTDQEICDLLTAHRREGGGDPDSKGVAYYARTIAKVRGGQPEGPDDGRSVSDENGEPIEALSLARKRLKLPRLRRVVKHGDSNALYDLELEDGTRIPLGTSADLMNPRKVDAAIADSTGVAIPYYGAPKFRTVAGALLAIVEVENTGSPEAEETCDWIGSLLVMGGQLVAMSPAGEGDGLQLADVVAEPEDFPCFRGDDRRLYLRLDAFHLHVRSRIGQRAITRRDLAARIARIGFTKHQPSVREAGRTLKARYWRSEPGFDPEDEE